MTAVVWSADCCHGGMTTFYCFEIGEGLKSIPTVHWGQWKRCLQLLWIQKFKQDRCIVNEITLLLEVHYLIHQIFQTCHAMQQTAGKYMIALMNLSNKICNHYFINLYNCIEHRECFDNSQLLSSGATRSVLQALMVRTAKAYVTVLMVPVATILMEDACASQGSTVHTAETGCVHMESMECTVKKPVSARTNTHSGKRLLREEERHQTRRRSLFYANLSRVCVREREG